MKQKYVSDPFVRISLHPKEDTPFQARRKSDSYKEQKRTSVRNVTVGYASNCHYHNHSTIDMIQQQT